MSKRIKQNKYREKNVIQHSQGDVQGSSEENFKETPPPDCVWRGWLNKKGHGISGRWLPRWFELREELGKKRRTIAVLKYFGRGTKGPNPSLTEKSLTIEEAWREVNGDRSGRACIAVRVLERAKPVLLSAASPADADVLLTDIFSILRAQPSAQAMDG